MPINPNKLRTITTQVETLTNLSESSLCVGEYKLVAYSTERNGWKLCNGQAVSRLTHSALFAVIGTTYGVGDGLTTFNLPDLRGRVAGCAGQGSGLTNRVLGASVGAEKHTLTIAEMPAHFHTFTDNYGVQNLEATFNNGTACDEIERTENTSSVGGGGAHNNMQPTLFAGYYMIYTGVAS